MSLGRELLAQGIMEARLQHRPRRRAERLALQSNQWLSSEDLLALQTYKLQRLINHAYNNVPYYHRVMGERGIRPEHIRSPKDLTLLPLLTRDIVRDNLTELRAVRGIPKQLVHTNYSSGSTGDPLAFDQDQPYLEWAEMDVLRGMEMCGYRIGKPIAFLWGGRANARANRTLRGKIVNFLDNKIYHDAYNATEENLIHFARQLTHHQPELLTGYTTSLVLLAQIIRDHNLTGVHPGAIETTAEVLSPSQREILEETFGCRVFNRYGCNEVGNIAHECEKHVGMHVLADRHILELLHKGHPAIPGEEGLVVVTNFQNRAMPLIRYCNNDRAVQGEMGPCSCGRCSPRLSEVVGREADIIKTPSGKLVHNFVFTTMIFNRPGVRQFDIVQDAPTHLRISLVPGPGFNEVSTINYLKQTILDEIDPSFEIEFVVTKNIPASPSGKFRHIRSEIQSN